MRVQGFCFSLLQYSHIQAFTARFVPLMQLYHLRRKTAHRALQWRFMRLSPPILKRYQTDTIDYNTTCATLERITAPGRHPHIPDTTVTQRSCTGQHSHRPCKPGGVLSHCVRVRWQVLRPAHLLTGQCLHLYRVSPAACDMAPGQLSGCTGSICHNPPGGAVQHQ